MNPGTSDETSPSTPIDVNPAFNAPVQPRELVAIAALVALADIVIYRGEGFGGLALFFALGPLILLLGSSERRGKISTMLVYVPLLLLVASLTWCGNPSQVTFGAALVLAFAMSLAGLVPWVLDVVVFACLAIGTGSVSVIKYLRSVDRMVGGPSRATFLKFGLPLVVVLGFALLFLQANPEEARSFFEGVRSLWNNLWSNLQDYLPPVSEYFFWLGAAIISAGLLRPYLRFQVFPEERLEQEAPPVANSAMAIPYRNTLFAVIALFAAYLVFEFASLWGRTFPKGFYYAGYAHQGAAWLTAALALATAVLSVIFRGDVQNDPRLPALRQLAWIWSVENLLLAVAVYHRLLIYVGFNGMTRMRTVGFLGITAVACGFLLVVWKIIHNRGFLWLIQRQMWALAAAVFLYVALPVDLFVHAYNVRRVLGGDLAPVVQISVHPIDLGGLVALRPLLGCDDEAIRKGIEALLAERESGLDLTASADRPFGWTRFQLAERILQRQMTDTPVPESLRSDSDERAAALRRFHEYAYQWY